MQMFIELQLSRSLRAVPRAPPRAVLIVGPLNRLQHALNADIWRIPATLLISLKIHRQMEPRETIGLVSGLFVSSGRDARVTQDSSSIYNSTLA